MSNYIFLSYPLGQSTPAYGGEKGFSSLPVKSLAAGDSSNTAFWQLPNHLGTHVDAPRHFFEPGEAIDSFAPSFWIFLRVKLLEVPLEKEGQLIGPADIFPFLKGKPDLLLIKTGMCYKRGERVYWENNPGLDPELGRALRSSFPSLRAVGIDCISISAWQNREAGREAHCAFLDPMQGEPLVLIEDMDLSQVSSSAKINKVIVLPLLVEDADGAPCTVLAELDA